MFGGVIVVFVVAMIRFAFVVVVVDFRMLGFDLHLISHTASGYTCSYSSLKPIYLSYL